MRSLPEWFQEDRWVPPPGSVEARRVWTFMRANGHHDYSEFLRRTVDDQEWFYSAALADLGLDWPTPWEHLYDSGDGPAWTRWFVGGRTNLAWLAVDRWRTPEHGARRALVWEGEDGQVREWTYEQLGQWVERLAAGFLAHGVHSGDVVAMYLPPLPEAAAAMLALARIGAIVAPAFSGYGVQALTERITLVGATHLITADGYLRRGQSVDMKSIADAAADLAGVQQVFVVPRLGTTAPARPRDVAWSELVNREPAEPHEWFTAEHPWLIAFTSGSSGRPKGAVHCHGRLPYRASIDAAYCFDMSDRSCLYWPSDMGWIIAPLGIVTSLILGGTHMLYEGVPTWPTPDKVWQLVRRHRVTHLGTSPTLVRQLAAHGSEHVDGYELESLEVLASAGEPMTSGAWRWLHRHVGRGVRPIMNHTGGTEIGCGLLSGSPVVPMHECQFAGPPPGMAVQVCDGQGLAVVGELGELAVSRPWPSMSFGFWNEPDRWSETYRSSWSGLYLHGDRAIQYPDGGWELPGRSDDVLKVGGKRIGPSEFEAIALAVPGVLGAAAVGVPDPVKGEAVIVLIEPAAGIADTAESLGAQVLARVEASLGKSFRPAKAVVVPELPLTRSGKVHRRALRGWLTGRDPGDLSNLENPASKAAIAQAGNRLRERERREPESEVHHDSRPHHEARGSGRG